MSDGLHRWGAHCQHHAICHSGIRTLLLSHSVLLLPFPPHQSASVVFALPLCHTTTQVHCISIIDVVFPSFLSYHHAHSSSPFSHRQRPPSLISSLVTCPSMYQSTHMTLRSLTLDNVVMCLLSFALGGSSTEGTNDLHRCLYFS